MNRDSGRGGGRRRLGALGVAILLSALMAGGVEAGEGAGKKEARGDPAEAAVLSETLALLRARIEARLGLAETLRQMGRFEEALAAYASVEELYAKGLTELRSLTGTRRPRPAVAVRPAPPPVRRGGAFDTMVPRPSAAGLKIGATRVVGVPFAKRGARPGARLGSEDGPMRLGLESALRWLAAHQSPNGSWECAGFPKWCDGKPAAEGPDGLGKAVYDAGVTGLALQAFLGAGHTNRGKHPYAKVVARGLRYLKNVQDAEGCFGPRSAQHFVYNHACAALAMVEAYGMTGSPIFKGSAQRALDFIAATRNPYLGWRYGVRPGDNDTSVTGWMLMALTSARLINEDAIARGKPAPLVIDVEAFGGARAWLDKMTDPDGGRVGYMHRGGAPARPQAMIHSFPADRSESMTAVGILSRVFLGDAPSQSEAIRKGARLLAACPPSWNANDGSVDMYYWYFGTLATYQVGGDDWKRWRTRLKQEVLSHQRSDTDACLYRGSWDPVGPWGPDGGRVYATALMAMCLEADYRYERLFKSD